MGIATALIVGGGILGASSQIVEARAQSAAEKYNAAIARQEAILAESTARAEIKITRAVGEVERRRIRKEKTYFTAQQEALYAKAGVRFEGSPIDVITETTAEFEMDALISKYNRDIDVWEIESRAEAKAWGLKAEAEMRERRAKEIRRAGYWRAGTTLLTTATQAYQYGGKRQLTT